MESKPKILLRFLIFMLIGASLSIIGTYHNREKIKDELYGNEVEKLGQIHPKHMNDCLIIEIKKLSTIGSQVYFYDYEIMKYYSCEVPSYYVAKQKIGFNYKYPY